MAGRATMSTFIRQQDNQAKRSTRVLNKQRGIHLGYSRTDQGDEYAFMSDFDVWQNRLRLRAGMRKNEKFGYTKTPTALFPMNILGQSLLGAIIGEQGLIIYPADDVAAGVQRFYTWDETKNLFVWDEVKQKTWQEMLTGGN